VSTVVDLSSVPWRLVREGSISSAVIARILG
jgi:tRNA A37 threonylcarbamoyladenosine synthetase subunit TsaC/SUA5/YrdC